MSERVRVDCLDGLRGAAALWVLVGHAHILTGWQLPLIGQPDLGVDLFIMLSGFLMVFHYRLRQKAEPWGSTRTWGAFWLRRFFRIAPLYYLLLVIALLLGPFIYESRLLIDATNSVPPQAEARYLDASLANILLHVSFIFGALPGYAFRTPLPDWSIGLEMQFYAVFPFLALMFARIGWLLGAALLGFVAVLTSFALNSAGIEFPMPSFLPLKIAIFCAGMLIAAGINVTNRNACIYGVFAVCLALLPIGGPASPAHIAMRGSMAIGFFFLIHPHIAPRVVEAAAAPVRRLFSGRIAHELGELSYGVYLIHLLVMQPVVASLIAHMSGGSQTRYALTLAVTIPSTYALAWITNRLIELPGQAVGRRLLKQSSKLAAESNSNSTKG